MNELRTCVPIFCTKPKTAFFLFYEYYLQKIVFFLNFKRFKIHFKENMFTNTH